MSRQGQKASNASPNSPSGPNQSPTANESAPRMADTIAPDGGDFDQALQELLAALVEGGASPQEAVQAVEQAVAPAPTRRAGVIPFEPPASAAVPNALSGDFDTSDVLARMPPQGPRVPFYGTNNALMPEPKSREGTAQYLELPGMRLPLDIAERPAHHAVGMARTVPMMFGMTGNAPGFTTSAIKNVVESIPKGPAAGAAAVTGLTAAPSGAGEQGPDAKAQEAAGRQLYEERARIEEQLRTATARREAARPVNRAPGPRDPIFNEAANEVSKLEAQKSANDALIKDHVRRNSPEYALEMKAAAEKQEREAREKRAATPTRELMSDYTGYIPAVTGGVALALGAAMKGRGISNFNTEIADLSKRWADAVARAQAARPGTRAADMATKEAQGLKAEYEALKSAGPSGTKEAIELGAGTGLVGGFLPEEIDFARAISGSPLWGDLKKNILDEWPSTLKRAAIAGGLGAGVGHIGSLLPRAFMDRPMPPGYGPATDALPPPRTPTGGSGGAGSAPKSRLSVPQGVVVAPPAPRAAPQASPPTQPTTASLPPRADGRPPLPAGMDYDVNGLPYDIRTGHKIKSKFFKPRGE